jgi:hypothetical protein
MTIINPDITPFSEPKKETRDSQHKEEEIIMIRKQNSNHKLI